MIYNMNMNDNNLIIAVLNLNIINLMIVPYILGDPVGY